MEKSIYDLLNETEIDTEAYETCELSQEEKDRILKNDILQHKLTKRKQNMNHNKKMTKKLGVAAACAALAITVSLGSASSFAMTNPIAHSIADMFGLTNNLSDYATVLTQEETKADVTVSLDEVVYDRENSKMIVATTVTGENTVIEEGAHWAPHLRLYIDGEHMNTAQQTYETVLDENTKEFVNVFMLKEQFDGDMDVNIHVAGVEVNGVYVQERWEFAFATNGDELSADTFIHDIALPVSLGGGAEIVVERLTVNPLSTSIFYSTEDLLFTQSVRLRGTDNLGNAVEFNPAPIVEGGYGGDVLLDTTEYTLTDEVTSFTLQVYSEERDEDGTILSYVPVSDEFVVPVR